MNDHSLEELRGYPPDYVSAETLAYRLDCSRSTIDAYVRSGFLPRPQSIGNLQRWDFGQVKAYIRAQNIPISARNAESDEEDVFLKGLESEPPKKGTR
jgi:predicted DNA-binding transcriptional regulator AlpA